MNIKFINKIKYSKTLYNVYYYFGSWSLNILKWFVITKKNLIVFNSFGGRKFDDSPKAIYDKMIEDPRFKDCDIVWAFMNPEKYDIPFGRKIKSDSLKYFITLLKARIWISNSGLERGLNFKGRNTFYFNTWHGTPIKKMGSDIDIHNTSMKTKSASKIVDIMSAQGEYEKEVFKRVFSHYIKDIAVIGLPRNDELARRNKPSIIATIKDKLGIPQNKTVILYAPTFREYEKDDANNCIMSIPLDLKQWEERLGDRFVFLLRAHYEVVRKLDIQDSDFVYDVSSWPSLNELMLISDLLISDYSSLFFDFSILGRPMLTYCYDYDKYAKCRGVYFDIREALGTKDIDNEGSLLNEIESGAWINRTSNTYKFRETYVTKYGKASQKSLDLIISHLK